MLLGIVCVLYAFVYMLCVCFVCVLCMCIIYFFVWVYGWVSLGRVQTLISGILPCSLLTFILWDVLSHGLWSSYIQLVLELKRFSCINQSTEALKVQMCTYSWSLIWTLGIRIKSSCFPKAWALQKLVFLNNCIYLTSIKKQRCLDVAWQFSLGWIYHWHLESNQVWLPRQDPWSMGYVNISPMKGRHELGYASLFSLNLCRDLIFDIMESLQAATISATGAFQRTSFHSNPRCK